MKEELLELLEDYAQWTWRRVTSSGGPEPVNVQLSLAGLMEYLRLPETLLNQDADGGDNLPMSPDLTNKEN